MRACGAPLAPGARYLLSGIDAQRASRLIEATLGADGATWERVVPEVALTRTLLDTDLIDGSTVALEAVAPDALDARATEAEKFAVKRRAKVC